MDETIELTKDEADKLADVLIPIKETATKTEKPEKTETKTTKQKISNAHKGKPSPMLGKHHSDEAKKRISESNKGKHY